MKKSPLRVVFAGTPEFAKVILQALIDCQQVLNTKIVAVYTQPDRKSGRGQKISQSPVKQLALHHNIAVEQPVSFSLKHEQGTVSRETLQRYQPDVMIVVAYGLLLPLGVLNMPKFGCLNVHASLLPAWRGAAPIQRVILAGDDETGVTIMQMTQGLDAGDILYQLACTIDATDTSQSLHDKLAKLGAEAIITVLQDLPNYQKQAKPQTESATSYAKKISTNDGLIDWQASADFIHRQIRALNAYTFLHGERIKVLQATPSNQKAKDLPFGTVVSIGRDAVVVACGQSQLGVLACLELTQLQWAGKNPCNAEQILNSHKVQVGDVFADSLEMK